jgi:hypothetical protein
MLEVDSCFLLKQYSRDPSSMLQVYGTAFNPLRPSSGRGCEFLTYGMKNLKTWVLDDEGNWISTAASFGVDRVQNVHCAIFVPAQHPGRAPGDSCIVTGFPDGTLGMWIPPFPTKAGSRYALKRVYKAHALGPMLTMNDGSQQYGGVCCLRLGRTREHKDMLISGGADGGIRVWYSHTSFPWSMDSACGDCICACAEVASECSHTTVSRWQASSRHQAGLC